MYRCCYGDEVLKRAPSLRGRRTSRTRHRGKQDVNTLFCTIVLRNQSAVKNSGTSLLEVQVHASSYTAFRCLCLFCFVLFCFVFLSPRRRGVPKPRFATNVILHLFPSQLNNGDVAWSVERRTGTSLTQVRFLCAARDFSPRVSFQCRLSSGVRTSPCAIACIYICAHVRDPVVHTRIRWIIKILKHPAYTVGWVTRLCRSLLSPGKATRFSHGSNPK